MAALDSNFLEKRSQKQAALLTLVIQGALLLAFYFMVVWKQPNPPTPIYGLELNLGFSDLGAGNLTSDNPALEEPSNETPAPGEISSATQVVQETSPQPTANKAVSAQPSPIKGETTPITSTKKTETPTEPIPEKVVTQPKVDQRALFGGGGTSGKGRAAGGAQGNTTTPGDEGRPSGNVDGRAMQGAGTGQGTAGGAGYSLDLAGWDFASKPTINDRVSTRNGRIVFKITVDDSGKVTRAITQEYTVSNEVLSYYRQVVNQMIFKKSSGASTANFSTGKITFVIKVD
jgi:outer membrane biosynthesis protein TonB